jgi:Mn2+/Fe2+ NRAMP family transporter
MSKESFFKKYGPGIFLIGANIGTGSASTMSTVGAYFGVRLIWAVVLSCLFTWVMVTIIGRVTCYNSTTILNQFKNHFGSWALILIGFAIAFTQFFSTMGALGIVSEATGELLDINKLYPAVFWGLFIFFAIYFGNYGRFESLLKWLVAIFGISFILTLIIVIFRQGFNISDFSQGIPEGEFSGWATAACVGTTFSSGILIMRSYLVLDKGWTKSDLKTESMDALISVIGMAILSVTIIMCATLVLYHSDILKNIAPIDFSSIQMAENLRPLAGKYTFLLFTIGIIGAGLSSVLPNALVSIWCISDVFKLERNTKRTYFRILGAIWAFSGVLGILTGRPVSVTVMAQALILLVTPLISILSGYIAFKDGLLGKKGTISQYIMIILCLAAILFSLTMSLIGFKKVL